MNQQYLFILKKKKSKLVNMLFRASTAGVVNVPNAKYLAHLPHQTPKTPIYQMC